MTVQTFSQWVFLVFVAVGVLLALVQFFYRLNVVHTLGLFQAITILVMDARNVAWPLELARKSIGLWLFLLLGFAVHRHWFLKLVLLGTLVLTIMFWPWLPPLPVRVFQ